MDTKFVAGALIGVVVVGGVGFWSGMTYAANKAPAGRGQFTSVGNFGGRGGAANVRVGGNTAFGTIVAKDPNSITVQLGGPNATGSTSSPQASSGQGAGSKIVLYNASTEVGKTVTASANDLSVGQMVTANGTSNSDGSITAQMIQIRPANTIRPPVGQ